MAAILIFHHGEKMCVFQHIPYIHKQEWMQQREHTGNMWWAFYLGLTLCLLGSVPRCQSIDLHYKTPTSLVHSFFFVYVTEKYRNIPNFLPTLENTVALIWFWYFYDGCTLVQKNTGTSQIFPHVGKKMLLIWFWYFYDRCALQRNVFRCIPILWALLHVVQIKKTHVLTCFVFKNTYILVCTQEHVCINPEKSIETPWSMLVYYWCMSIYLYSN